MIFLELFYTFFKIGLFTFGGGYAMIPLIQSEVLAKEWAKPEELINFIAVAESTPGPFAINIATYVGAEQGYKFLGIAGRFLGSACATLGVVMPSFIIILIVAKFYLKFKNNKYIAGAMSGLRPAAIALISAAMISIGTEVFLPYGFSLQSILTFEMLFSVITLGLCLFLVYKKAKPHFILLASAACGLIWGSIQNLFM